MKRGMDVDRLWGQWVIPHEEDEPSPGGLEPPEDRRSTCRCMPTIRVDLARSEGPQLLEVPLETRRRPQVVAVGLGVDAELDVRLRIHFRGKALGVGLDIGGV